MYCIYCKIYCCSFFSFFISLELYCIPYLTLSESVYSVLSPDAFLYFSHIREKFFITVLVAYNCQEQSVNLAMSVVRKEVV